MNNPEHIVRCYRNYILGCKRKYKTARSQVHYLHLVKAYLEAKREMLRPLSSVGLECSATNGKVRGSSPLGATKL